jgi:hypothetical protein
LGFGSVAVDNVDVLAAAIALFIVLETLITDFAGEFTCAESTETGPAMDAYM